MHYCLDDMIGIIADIYEEYDIHELGFNLMKVIKDAGVALIPYSSYDEKSDKLVEFDKDAFSYYDPNNNCCVLAYNDSIRPVQRLNFTLAHEFWHIIDGHIFSTRRRLYFEDDTNTFARYFYCPIIILVKENICSVPELMSKLNITMTYAEVIAGIIKNYKLYRVKDKLSNNEKRLLKVFYSKKI